MANAIHTIYLLLLPFYTSCLVAEAAFGHAPVAANFEERINSHFISSTKVSYAKRRAARLGKPLLVLLTRSGCGACQNLKQSFNRGQDAVALLDKFVVVHAQDEQQAQWQAPSHGYAPQTHFYAPGEEMPLPIHGSSDKSPYFFHDEPTILWGMKKALEVVQSGERWNKEESQPKEL